MEKKTKRKRHFNFAQSLNKINFCFFSSYCTVVCNTQILLSFNFLKGITPLLNTTLQSVKKKKDRKQQGFVEPYTDISINAVGKPMRQGRKEEYG